MIRAQRLRTPTGGTLTLAGGILGLAEDEAEATRLLEEQPWDILLLGIPFEDLDAIRATNGSEITKEFEQDSTDDLYLKLLGKFGRVRVPPPDLYATFRLAQVRKIPIEAIDLGDEAHSIAWTQNVGMFELLRNNRRLKHLDKERFESQTAEAFAHEWDEVLFPTKGLKKVQAERETWMTQRIVRETKAYPRVFALVPLARSRGIQARLMGEARFVEARPVR